MQGEPAEHPPWPAIHHVDVGVARAVAGDLEGGGDVAKLPFKPGVRPERQPAHLRMKAVGPDHQVEPLFRAVTKLNPDTLRPILQPDDLVPEYDLRRARDFSNSNRDRSLRPSVT